MRSKVRPLVRSLHAAAALAALMLVLVALGAIAHAQSRATVTIDFPFVAAGTTLPAGAYQLEVTTESVVLRPQAGSQPAVTMLVLTRLGRHDKDPGPELVFDKVKDEFRLSEIWLPEADGYLVLNTPTNHEHRVLGGSAPHK